MLILDVNKLIQNYGNKIKFSAGIKPMITLEIGSTNERQILNDVTELLKFINSNMDIKNYTMELENNLYTPPSKVVNIVYK